MAKREQMLEDITAQVADAACKRICRRIIRWFQQESAEFSGADSGLRNSWDEVCVQVQDQHSVFWTAYEATLIGLIRGEVMSLDPKVRNAVWLQTEVWDYWSEEDDEPDMSEPDIIEYLYREYVLSAAADWTNARIQRYLERGLLE